MKPPIYEICHRDFPSEPQGGGLVHFANYATLPDKVTGHPRGGRWFCKRHYKAAAALRGQPMAAALRRLLGR